MSSTPEIDEISKKRNNLSIRKGQCQDYFGENVKNKLVNLKILIMNI